MKKEEKSMVLEEKITLGNQTITYQIRRSAKAKNVSFRIKEESGLEVVVPQNSRLSNIPELLSQKENWILDKLKLMEENAAQKKAAQDDALLKIRYLGQEYQVVVILDHSSPIRVELKGEKAFFTMPQNEGQLLRKVIEAWYHWAAKIFFKEKVDFWAEKMNVTYSNISVRNQKTRWGSCSRKQNISLNVRLIMAPVEVVDYIIIHELAHLKEMNHSKNFWQVVEEFCPDFKEQLSWLKKYGAGLIL